MFLNLKDKEDYRLMWECLKRSKYYVEFCKWRSKEQRNPDLSIPDEFLYPSDDDIRPASCGVLIDHFPIHSFTTFDEWWNEHYEKRLKEEVASREANMITDYVEEIEKDIDICITILKHQENREPTLGEFKEYFLGRLRKESQFGSKPILKVGLGQGSTDDLVKKFREVIREKRNVKITRTRRDEIKRYLKIYDLKEQGMTMANIIKKIGTPSQKEYCRDPDVMRTFRRNLKKAKTLIKNAELCDFPVYE